MTIDREETTRQLIVSEAGADALVSSAAIGAGADLIWTRFAQRFSRLIGDAGIRTIQERTRLTSASRLPWLALPSPTADGGDRASLAVVLAVRPPAEALTGITDLVTGLITLLARFIGASLVDHVLHEMWPHVFLSVAKEPA